MGNLCLEPPNLPFRSTIMINGRTFRTLTSNRKLRQIRPEDYPTDSYEEFVETILLFWAGDTRANTPKNGSTSLILCLCQAISHFSGRGIIRRCIRTKTKCMLQSMRMSDIYSRCDKKKNCPQWVTQHEWNITEAHVLVIGNKSTAFLPSHRIRTRSGSQLDIFCVDSCSWMTTTLPVDFSAANGNRIQFFHEAVDDSVVLLPVKRYTFAPSKPLKLTLYVLDLNTMQWRSSKITVPSLTNIPESYSWHEPYDPGCFQGASGSHSIVLIYLYTIVVVDWSKNVVIRHAWRSDQFSYLARGTHFTHFRHGRYLPSVPKTENNLVLFDDIGGTYAGNLNSDRLEMEKTATGLFLETVIGVLYVFEYGGERFALTYDSHNEVALFNLEKKKKVAVLVKCKMLINVPSNREMLFGCFFS